MLIAANGKELFVAKKSGHVIQLHLQNSAPIVDDLIDAEFFSEFEHGHDGGDPKSAFSVKSIILYEIWLICINLI